MPKGQCGLDSSNVRVQVALVEDPRESRVDKWREGREEVGVPGTARGEAGAVGRRCAHLRGS